MRELHVIDEATLARQIGDVVGGRRGPVLVVPSDVQLDIPAQEYQSWLPKTVPDEVQLVVRTSGSTGVPKLVAHSVASIQAAITGSADALNASASDSARWLLALPTHYIAGFLVLARAYAAGHPAVPLSAAHFDALQFLSVARAHGDEPLYASLVPVQLQRLVDTIRGHPSERSTIDKFKTLLLGGQRLDAELRATAEAAGFPIVATYGASETAGGCCYDGRPIGDTRAKIVGERIWLGGSSVALGYLDEDGTLANRDGFAESEGVRWYISQDRGSFDPSGRLIVSGRVDAVINRGGVKLDLAEVERWISGRLHAPCVLVPVADSTWGQGYVVVTPQRAVNEAELARELVDTFGRHARPTRVDVRELPALASGKPDRRQLAEDVAVSMATSTVTPLPHA